MKQVSTADGSQTLYSERYAQTFHSDKGAITESKHVFLDLSGVTERLSQKQATSVLEVGFGTGLNFFLSADQALKHKAKLHYLALEQSLLSADIVKTLEYQQELKHKELLAAYLAFRSSLETKPTGKHIFSYERVILELFLGEATMQVLPEGFFDAVYQDAFSPEANAELWSASFLTKLYLVLKPAGVLTTYSVKGDIRRLLASIGFDVKKAKGPPNGKREVLKASKP